MSHQKSRPRIALLVEASRAYGRELLRGVSYFARTQVDWSLLHQEMTLDSAMPEWMRQSRIDGVIARVDTHNIESLRELKAPMVDVRCNRKFTGVPQIETDNQRVAELAFEHLWNRGFRRFAFCGFRFAAYSEARLCFFRKLVQQSDCPFDFYESEGRPGSTLTSLEEAGSVETERLSRWLTTLKRPTGLFVCNDIRGQQVLNVCRSAGMTLEQIAPKAGYSHKESLSAVFKRETGGTPGDYRRRSASGLSSGVTLGRPSLTISGAADAHHLSKD